MQRLRLLLILTAALLLAATETRLGEAPAAEGAFPGANGKLLVSTGDLATANIDGSGVTVIHDGLSGEWSADGQRIAFTDDSGIFVMNSDGSNVVPVAPDPLLTHPPTFSPDGERVAFFRFATPLKPALYTIDIESGVETLVGHYNFRSPPKWSPSGDQLAFVALGDEPSPNETIDIHVVGVGGAHIRQIVIPAHSEIAVEWSPDGSQIAYLAYGGTGDPHELNGVIGRVSATGGAPTIISPFLQAGGLPALAWSPDGRRIAVTLDFDFGGFGLQTRIMNTDGSNVVTIPQPNSPDPIPSHAIVVDWQPRPAPPIVFIHGFLGSRINCGADELWPDISLVPPSRPEFLQMLLADDGVSTAPGACDVTVGDTLDEVLGTPIYQGATDFFDEFAPGNVSYFNWDWRKSPEPSLALLDAFIDDIRASHGDQKVVLVGHSYGGLLARWYVDDAGRADKVARVVTIGTPAWGSPKALFQLYAGIETPDLSGLDLFMDNEDLHEFAKNLFGDYFLYPSASYGPWLTVHPSETALNRQGLLDYVTQLGGNAALLDQALAAHASVLDSFAPSGVDFEVIVGAGLPTIAEVGVTPDGFLLIDYSNGDSTVPVRSAARGVAGPTNPNAAHTHYSCGVSHVDLPGDPQVTDAIEDFLLSGDPIEGLQSSPCPANGMQFRLFQLPSVVTSAPAGAIASTGAMALEDAVLQGVVDYLDLPKEKFVIAGTIFPEVALPEGRFLEVTPISDGTKGAPSIYGPLEGQISISSDAGGPAVFVDGDPVEPTVAGDADCDDDTDAFDALAVALAVAQVGPTAACIQDANVKCDDGLTMADVLLILRYSAVLSVALPSGCPKVEP